MYEKIVFKILEIRQVRMIPERQETQEESPVRYLERG